MGVQPQFKRDLSRDMITCKTRPPGPVKWMSLAGAYQLCQLGRNGLHPFILTVMKFAHGKTKYWAFATGHQKDGMNEIRELKPDDPVAKFIEESWEGWPEAVDRAILAEDRAEYWYQEAKAARGQVDALKKALERALQGLGNLNNGKTSTATLIINQGEKALALLPDQAQERIGKLEDIAEKARKAGDFLKKLGTLNIEQAPALLIKESERAFVQVMDDLARAADSLPEDGRTEADFSSGGG